MARRSAFSLLVIVITLRARCQRTSTAPEPRWGPPRDRARGSWPRSHRGFSASLLAGGLAVDEPLDAGELPKCELLPRLIERERRPGLRRERRHRPEHRRDGGPGGQPWIGQSRDDHGQRRDILVADDRPREFLRDRIDLCDRTVHER